MAESLKKKFRNAGQRNIQLAPRKKGEEHFVVAPGEVFEPVDAKESAMCENMHELVEVKAVAEHKETGKSKKE